MFEQLLHISGASHIGVKQGSNKILLHVVLLTLDHALPPIWMRVATDQIIFPFCTKHSIVHLRYFSLTPIHVKGSKSYMLSTRKMKLVRYGDSVRNKCDTRNPHVWQLLNA
jgi:hypothetical protein